MTSINDLPQELLVHIFSFYVKSQGHRRFLKNIPRVCKRWNYLHSSPSLWNDIDFTAIACLRWPWTLDQLKKLGERGLLSSARNLDLDNTYWCSESEITEVICYCHNLRELRARHISKVAMEILAVQCTDIQKLDIRHGPAGKHVEDSLIPFLRVRGQNMTHLKLSCKDKDLVSTIAKYCHSLEELMIHSKHDSPNVELPINELVLGCPKLRNLRMWKCKVVLSEVHHAGFENMVKFGASFTDCGGLNLYCILKNSKNLETLDITSCPNLVLNGLVNISSDKLNYIDIVDQNLYNCSSTFLEEIVRKWRRTLTWLCFRGVLEHDLTKVLEAYLNENKNPKLEVLDFKRSGSVKRQVLNEVIRACENLQRVLVYGPERINLRDREEVEEYLNEMDN